MYKYLHFEDDSESTDKSHQFYISGNRWSKLRTRFFILVDLIIKLKSSACAHKSISLRIIRIEHNLLWYMRKIIKDKGETYTIPLYNGKNWKF